MAVPFHVPPEKVPLVTVPEKVGVVIVGDVANTTPPLPVGAVMHAMVVLLVAVQKSLVTKLPKATGEATPALIHSVPLQYCSKW